MRYFVKKTSSYTAKNKLQEAASAYFQTAEIDRRIIDGADLPAFLSTHTQAIEKLNEKFPRCKNKIEARSYQNHSSNDFTLCITDLIFFNIYAETEYISEKIKILSCPDSCKTNDVTSCPKTQKTAFIDAIKIDDYAIYRQICWAIIDAKKNIKHIIIDGISDAFILKQILCLFYNETFFVNLQGKESFTIPTPNLIITTNLDCRFLSTEESKKCQILEVSKEKEVINGQ